MIVKYFSESDTNLWERFVSDSRNGTFMQQRKFLSYHPSERFCDKSLMVFNKKNHLLAVVPGALRIENDNKVLFSHPGASHGGIIVGHNTKTTCILEIVSTIKGFCLREGFNGVEIRSVPRIYHKWPCEEVDYALIYNGFKIIKTELATALPLELFHDKKANESTLRSVRKAMGNNIQVKESNDIKSYWNILTNNLNNRHQTKPTHTYEEIQKLFSMFKEKIKLFGAFYKDRLIAGTIIFALNDRVLNCFYIAHDQEYQQYRPLNLLFYRLINWAKKEGFVYLDWGISTEAGGTKVNTGLFNFKEGFGGRGVLREVYGLSFDR